MNLPASPPDETFDLRAFGKRLVEAHIWAVRDDPAEMKARIMIAHASGLLSAEEVEQWIVLHALEAA